LKDTSFRALISDILKNGVEGNGMQRYLLFFKNKKAKYVEVYYLTHIEEIGEILNAI
jgi:hypothetical protein